MWIVKCQNCRLGSSSSWNVYIPVQLQQLLLLSCGDTCQKNNWWIIIMAIVNSLGLMTRFPFVRDPVYSSTLSGMSLGFHAPKVCIFSSTAFFSIENISLTGNTITGYTVVDSFRSCWCWKKKFHQHHLVSGVETLSRSSIEKKKNLGTNNNKFYPPFFCSAWSLTQKNRSNYRLKEAI